MAVKFNPFTGNLDLIDTTAAAGSSTQVQFNDAGLLAGSAGLVYDKTSSALTAASFIPSGASVPANGVYLPAANSVGIATGSSERLRITADGNLGLGTSSPQGKLDVVSGADSRLLIRDVADGNGLRIDSVNAANSVFAPVNFSGSYLRFSPNNTEAVRIDSSGRLLVGTSSARSAGNAFQNATGAQIFIEASAADLTLATFVLNRGDTNSSTIVLGKSRGTSPGSVVTLQNNDGIGRLAFAGADGSSLDSVAATVEAVVDGTPGTNDMPGRLVFSTTADGSSSPTERMRIDSSGRVGIGTTNPSSLLHTSTASGFNIFQQDSGSVGTYLYADSTGQGWVGTRTNHSFVLGTNNSERARIDSSGRLLVGTSSARANFYNSAFTAPVQIEGTSVNNAAVSVVANSASAATAPVLALGKTAGTLGSNAIVSSGHVIGEVVFSGNDGAEFVVGAKVSSAVDGTPASDSMPCRLIFSTTASGSATPTERMRIKSNGVINFASCPTYADDSAAGTGGLVAGDIYKTSTGELRIKL